MTLSTRLAIPLAAALTLSGCLSFGPKPPPTLIRLQPAETAPADAGSALAPGRAVTVMVPSVPAELSVLRVPVRSGTAALAYLENAQYADAPARLFRDLLMESIRARTGRPTLEGRDYHLAPGARLSTRIDQFAVDADGSKVDMVVDAVLQTQGTAPPTTRRFEAHVPIAAVDAASVSPILGQAANQVAQQIADWVGR